jgi:hypothetical protein
LVFAEIEKKEKIEFEFVQGPNSKYSIDWYEIESIPALEISAMISLDPEAEEGIPMEDLEQTFSFIKIL